MSKSFFHYFNNYELFFLWFIWQPLKLKTQEKICEVANIQFFLTQENSNLLTKLSFIILSGICYYPSLPPPASRLFRHPTPQPAQALFSSLSSQYTGQQPTVRLCHANCWSRNQNTGQLIVQLPYLIDSKYYRQVKVVRLSF